VKWRESPKRKAFFGFYFPRSEPRNIPDQANIDPSVRERQESGGQYNPINLP